MVKKVFQNESFELSLGSCGSAEYFFVFRLRSEKLLGIFFVLDQKIDYRDGFFKIWLVPY